MYHVGEKVVYASEGACVIEAIEEKDYGQEIRDYYRLSPLYHQRSIIYVPVQNEQKGRLRQLMSKSSFEEIIEKTALTPTEWINDNKRRQQYALEVLKSGDVTAILLLIKNMLFHQQEKMLNSRDKELLQKAQRLVFSEMAAVYGQDYDDIANEIIGKMMSSIEQGKNLQQLVEVE